MQEAYRGQNIAAKILAYLCETYQKEGYPIIGVDCETLNPTALHFWGKYFSPYTYTYIRRFDERAKDYERYFHHYFSSPRI